MTDIEDLRERLTGERFYDEEQEEAFTVIGFKGPKPLALLQYDDGVGWDESAAAFIVDDIVSQVAGLEEDGLDSERYFPLGSGPQIEQVCEPIEHEWYPWPDKLWPHGVPDEARERIAGHPRDFYNRIARCRRCGLSGAVAGKFGVYGSDSDGQHSAPWFCTECDETVAGFNLVYERDLPFCPDCAEDI